MFRVRLDNENPILDFAFAFALERV
nr:translational initiation factor 1 [Geum japonicum]WFP43096.1 translational initiation factor 1 [Geum japonicum]